MSELRGSMPFTDRLTARHRRDLETCREILAAGSKSFALAARFLPERLRDPVAAYYAFCRVSDDLVDESRDPRAALTSLHVRLDAAFTGRPMADPVDRALAWAIEAHALPRAPLDALLDGYLWDVERRTFPTLSSVIAYSARVAASVGVTMTMLMGVRDRSVLARAADLGVAMQLVNIARDVGEDARRGRTYLPIEWLAQEDAAVDIEAPRFTPAVGRVVRRVIDHADVLAARARTGIPALPRDCRVAIRAAASIYGDIGRVIRERRYDTITGRAHTGAARKALLLARSIAEESVASAGTPARSPDEPLAEVAFLLEGDSRCAAPS
jgi:phytoene synthase